ncbi:hypothetical protein QGM71_03290 [Virgibacillus sp. C22-A2]|uniref:DUF2512 family protein n=1 Tax=Virgibacillus tibetensis TaxID=3042313 RepID=A0ABU6KBT7_9BACI|nr:hypothetical protein [Virgibacillus sp. C22-A2]
MTGLVVKLIVTPIGIILASWIFPNVNFAYWFQPIVLGVSLAFIGVALEMALLRENTIWLSTLLDFIASAVIIYLGALYLFDTYVTFWGAVLTGALLAVTEIFQHYWLVNSKRVQKEPVG